MKYLYIIYEIDYYISLYYYLCSEDKFIIVMKRIKENISSYMKEEDIQSLSACDVEALKSDLRAQTIKEITSSKDSAIAFLQTVGICDEKGNLTPLYR